jgi:hypothetical protein
MTVDCQWVEKNLEALFSEKLGEEESRLFRAHVESCVPCRREVQALNAIDPLIKSYFQHELRIARRPRAINRARVFGLSAAAAVFAAVLVLLVMRTPQTPSVLPPVANSEPSAPVVEPPTPPPIKEHEPAEVLRSKPTAGEPNATPDVRPQKSPAVTANSPDFLVTDPAGYSHNIEEYRGRVVVVGVWSRNQAESIANLERLYRANATNTKLRLLGVSNEHEPKPTNTTFPIFYNQGSKLFGAKPGEFVLLDENGAAELRGSLVKDFDNLTKALRAK